MSCSPWGEEEGKTITLLYAIIILALILIALMYTSDVLGRRMGQVESRLNQVEKTLKRLDNNAEIGAEGGKK